MKKNFGKDTYNEQDKKIESKATQHKIRILILTSTSNLGSCLASPGRPSAYVKTKKIQNTFHQLPQSE